MPKRDSTSEIAHINQAKQVIAIGWLVTYISISKINQQLFFKHIEAYFQSYIQVTPDYVQLAIYCPMKCR